MKFSFTKMQGCANDYIYLDCRTSGVPEEIAAGSLRLTLGKNTTPEEIAYTVECLKECVRKLREKSLAYKEYEKTLR